MTTYTYNTPSGTEITIRIITRTTNLADSRFENDCYEISLIVSGRDYTPRGIVEHGDYPYGLINCGPVTMGGQRRPLHVPMDSRAREIYDEYRAEISRRVDRTIAIDNDYEASRRRINEAMNQ